MWTAKRKKVALEAVENVAFTGPHLATSTVSVLICFVTSFFSFYFFMRSNLLNFCWISLLWLLCFSPVLCLKVMEDLFLNAVSPFGLEWYTKNDIYSLNWSNFGCNKEWLKSILTGLFESQPWLGRTLRRWKRSFGIGHHADWARVCFQLTVSLRMLLTSGVWMGPDSRRPRGPDRGKGGGGFIDRFDSPGYIQKPIQEVMKAGNNHYCENMLNKDDAFFPACIDKYFWSTSSALY